MTEMIFSGLYGILTIWITGFIVTFRKQLTCMVGMMAAMALGMTIGFAAGTLLALWLPGQFFHSTVLSMLIGGAVGTIAGAPISLMAILDGLLSGIMGGMMGTMLMVMIPAPYVGTMIKIVSILCSGIVFLLFLMLQGEVKPDLLRSKFFLLSKPLSMFLVISLAFSIIQFGPTTFYPNNGLPTSPHNEVNEHSGHVHDSLSKEPDHSDTLVNKELVVQAKEFSFTPSSIHVIAGQKIRITLDNTGRVEHDFEIVGTNIHIHAAPSKKSTMVVSLDKAGYYQVICTLPGHKEAGMSASIQVAKSL